ncbi:YheC/YheD family protein [Oceanobacillus timonensis]|uniref:YheC/YheD family protein n=1 Tax=Oceanobacillus timonensis TaxID=1926285 RepID=UPI001FE7FF73|nr:YheC/YheD family protein [Oceanobacillus timonensis]
MTNFKKPTKLATMTSLIAKSYGIDIVYMTPKDVNIEEQKINGKVMVDSKWVNKETDIPPFIDAAIYCFKKENKEVMDFLRESTFLSDTRVNLISKEKLQEVLKDDAKFAHLIIPTHKLEVFDDLYPNLIKYNKVVIKPGKGIKGKDIYSIEKIGEDTFKIGYQRNEWNVNLNGLKTYFDEILKQRNYILQKYIASKTPQGDPFDIRIHVERDRSGKWSIAKIYVRIGIGQSVVSNVSQGGGVSDPIAFLKAFYGDKWETIYSNLVRVGKTLPKKMEKLRKTHIMHLGIDIGIESNGDIYLFETNDGPGTTNVVSEAAFHRSNYYAYVLNKKLNYPLKDLVDVIDDDQHKISQLETAVSKETEKKEKKEKQIQEMINSTSWKITGFLRKAKKLVKKT